MRITAYMGGYPDYPKLAVDFKISIHGCYIVHQDLPFISNMSYSVGGGKSNKIVDFGKFNNSVTGVGWYPPCDYAL